MRIVEPLQLRRITDDGYRSVPFPFAEFAAPPFELELRVTREGLAGYLRTWSATRNFMKQHNEDPVEVVERALETVWAPGEQRTLRWPLHVRAGRKSS